MKAITLLSCLMAFSLLSGGCATGPQYEYVQQGDSASIVGPIEPTQDSDYGSCQIVIVKIDALNTNFMASRPGLNWPFVDTNKRLYLSPGRHAVTLDIGQIDEVIGETGRRGIGTIGATAYGSRPTLTAEFAANHLYRFTADLSSDKKSIVVTQWDETHGASARTPVTSWPLDSNGNYSENIPPVK